METMKWFRVYNDIMDDEKLRLVSPDDRWFFVALMACKSSGMLESKNRPLLRRRMAMKLGLSPDSFDEVIRRLSEVELIDDQTYEPINWDKRQFRSDSSKERVKAYRERISNKKQTVKEMEQPCNVTVTVQDTDTDTDTDTELESKSKPLEAKIKSRACVQAREPSNSESSTAKQIRAAVEIKREWLTERYPDADIDLEIEELVAKYHGQSLGADPLLVILRWFRNLKNKPARADPSPSGGVTMAEALEMFPLKSFGGKRGPAKD